DLVGSGQAATLVGSRAPVRIEAGRLPDRKYQTIRRYQTPPPPTLLKRAPHGSLLEHPSPFAASTPPSWISEISRFEKRCRELARTYDNGNRAEFHHLIKSSDESAVCWPGRHKPLILKGTKPVRIENFNRVKMQCQPIYSGNEPHSRDGCGAISHGNLPHGRTFQMAAYSNIVQERRRDIFEYSKGRLTSKAFRVRAVNRIILRLHQLAHCIFS